MYILAGCIIVLYIALFRVAGYQRMEEAPPGIMGRFYWVAVFLYRKLQLLSPGLFERESVRLCLERLHPGKDYERVKEEYYGKKISLFLLICLGGTVFGLLASFSVQSNKALKDGVLTRSEDMETMEELEVAVTLSSGAEKRFEVTVEPRQLSDEEAAAYYEEFAQALPELIRGSNPSLTEVTEDLLLEEYFADYPFYVEWKSHETAVISSQGSVQAVEEATEVLLGAEICYGELSWQTELVVTVMPRVLSEEEALERELSELLAASDESSRTESEWELPLYYQGEELLWRQVVQDNGVLIFLGGLGVAVLVFVLADKDLHDELEQRKALMRRDYPDVVQKLLLYLGAGMTVRAALGKIAGKKQGSTKQECSSSIYEELRYTVRELQAGITEAAAYEHLAKRIGVQEYFRLSTLLVQNVKKGNSALLGRLREETVRANMERLQNSRRMAEEASTKLLLPMVLFLGVVMLMIIIPAFTSVGV